MGPLENQSLIPDIVQQAVDMHTLEDTVLVVLNVAVSLAFGWILWPFYGAILWGVVAAIVFAPLYRRLLQAMQRRRSPAAIATPEPLDDMPGHRSGFQGFSGTSRAGL